MVKPFILSLLALFGWASILDAASERSADSESKQTVEHSAAANPWYRDNEWNLGLWGNFIHTRHRVEKSTTDIGSTDRFLGDDEGWGAGLDLQYFFHRYFGVGIEAYGLAMQRDTPSLLQIVDATTQEVAPLEAENHTVISTLATFTFRYPVGRFAPYVFGGAGASFNGGNVLHVDLFGRAPDGTHIGEISHHGPRDVFLGQVGAGLEFRFTRHIAFMGDYSWSIVEGPSNNFGMFRYGLNVAF